jgi:hypothetical protein
MGTGSFPGVWCDRGVTLTPHTLLVPRSKIGESYTSTLPTGLRGLWKVETYIHKGTNHCATSFNLPLFATSVSCSHNLHHILQHPYQCSPSAKIFSAPKHARRQWVPTNLPFSGYREYSDGDEELTTHLHLAPTLRTSRGIPPLFHDFTACKDTTYHTLYLPLPCPYMTRHTEVGRSVWSLLPPMN